MFIWTHMFIWNLKVTLKSLVKTLDVKFGNQQPISRKIQELQEDYRNDRIEEFRSEKTE